MRGCLATGCACLPVAGGMIAGLLEPFVDRLLHDSVPARDAGRSSKQDHSRPHSWAH